MVKQLKKIAAIGLSVITAATATLGLSLSASAEDSAETLKTVFDYSSLTQGGAAPKIPINGQWSFNSEANTWDNKAVYSAKAGDGCLKLFCKGDKNFDAYNDCGAGATEGHWLTVTYTFKPDAAALEGDGFIVDYHATSWTSMFWRIKSRGKLFFERADKSNIGKVGGPKAKERLDWRLKYSDFKTLDGAAMSEYDIENIDYIQLCWIPPQQVPGRSDGVTLSIYKISVINPVAHINHAMLDYSDLSAGMSVKGITAKTHYGWNGGEVAEWEQFVSRSVTGSDGGVILKCKTTQAGKDSGYGWTGWQTVKPALCFTLPLSSEQLSGNGIVLDYKAISSCRTFYSVTSGGRLFFVDGVGDTNNSNIPLIAANTEGLRELRYSSFKRADGTYITEEEIQNISSFRICFNPTEWETSYLLKGVYVIDSPEKNHTYTTETESDKRGSVTGGGTFEYNTEVTLAAVPEKNFAFVGWYRGNQATPVSSDASYTFTALPELADKVYTAKFISVLKGDANDDGAMDILDLVRLKKYLADSESTEINENTANIVADEAIDSNDLALLRRWLIAAD